MDQATAAHAEKTLTDWTCGLRSADHEVRSAIDVFMQSDPRHLASRLDEALRAPVNQSETTQAEIHAAMAFATHRIGDLEASTAHAEASLAVFPDAPRLLGLLAGIRASQGRSEEATQLAHKAVELSGGEDPNLLTILGVSLMKTRRYNEAIAVLRRARSLHQPQAGLMDALLRSYFLKWQAPIKLLVFLMAAWAVVDPGVIGTVFAAVVMLFCISLAVMAGKNNRAKSAALLVFIALAVIAGHLLLAPLAFG